MLARLRSIVLRGADSPTSASAGKLEPLLAAIRVPDTEESRAGAIGRFVAQAGELHATGRHDDVVQLASAWEKALKQEAPDDPLALTEVNLIYWNEVDKGGHFAAWEQPQIFSEELRAAFRPLRDGRSS